MGKLELFEEDLLIEATQKKALLQSEEILQLF